MNICLTSQICDLGIVRIQEMELHVKPGSTYTRVAEEAWSLAMAYNCDVSFDFNGRRTIIQGHKPRPV